MKYPATSHSFDINLATELKSVDLALLIAHFSYWIQFNERTKKNFHKGKYWTYDTQKEIKEHFPYWSERHLKTLIQKLVKLKIIERGNFNKTKMDKTCWYAFTDDYLKKIITKDENVPSMDENVPSMDENVQAIPQSKPESITRDLKGNVSAERDNEKTLPLKKSKKDIGVETKFPLRKEQAPLFIMLKSLDLECDDNTLFILIRSYRERQIYDAVDHLNYEIEQGTKFKKGKIAFFRASLQGKISPINQNTKINKKFAQKAKEKGNWTSLVISDKYVFCEKCHKELHLNQSPKEFKNNLFLLFTLSKEYQ